MNITHAKFFPPAPPSPKGATHPRLFQRPLSLTFLLLLVHLLSACLTNLRAQEQLGLRTGSFSGVNALSLNPAAATGMPLAWDVNLIEAGIFGQTNYAFVNNGGLLPFWRARKNLIFDVPETVSSTEPPISGAFIVDFRTNRQHKHLAIISNITGPSFFVSLPGGNKIGLISRARFMLMGYKVPSVLDYYTYEAKPNFEDFEVEPFHTGLMSWSELGLHFSHEWETWYGTFGFGITGKYLQGYEAAFFDNNNPTTIAKLPGDSLIGVSADLSYGLTLGAFEENGYRFGPTGHGLGLDLGMQITGEGPYEPHSWRIGIALLLDLGRINFDQLAQQYRVQIDNKTIILDTEPLTHFQRTEFTDTLIGGFSEQLLGDPRASFVGDAFQMWLPTALSLQGEVALTDDFFLHGLLIQRLAYRPSVSRGNFLALTARYEKKYWGVWLPLSLYNYTEFQLGLALKAGPLTIGTERLASFFSNKQWDGLDFYFALKVPPFSLQKTLKDKRGHRRGKGPRCYEF